MGFSNKYVLNSPVCFFLEGLAHWAIPEKIQKGGLEDILSWKRPLEYLNLSLYPWKFQTKWSFTPGNSKKMYCTQWNFQGQKPRPTEIPCDFFLIAPRISTFYYTWKFHVFITVTLKAKAKDSSNSLTQNEHSIANNWIKFQHWNIQ